MPPPNAAGIAAQRQALNTRPVARAFWWPRPMQAVTEKNASQMRAAAGATEERGIPRSVRSSHHVVFDRRRTSSLRLLHGGVLLLGNAQIGSLHELSDRGLPAALHPVDDRQAVEIQAFK